MRIESSVTSISWIPSEAMTGPLRVPVDLGIGHYDDPPPTTSMISRRSGKQIDFVLPTSCGAGSRSKTDTLSRPGIRDTGTWGQPH